jgi:hypothetical protein
VGEQFCRCAGPGRGLRAGLTNNLIIYNIMQAFTERLARNTKARVDPVLVLDTLHNSAARTGWITCKTTLVFNNKAYQQPSQTDAREPVPGVGFEESSRRSITFDQFDPADASSGRRQSVGLERFCFSINVLQCPDGYRSSARKIIYRFLLQS